MDPDLYDPDLTLIVEADQADIDRLERVMDQLDADSEDLGDLAEKFAPMLRKLPGNKGVLVTRKLKRANKGRQQMSQIMRRLLQRKQARMQACKAHKLPRRSPVTRNDIVGRVQTPTPLYAVLTLKQGVLSDSIRSMSGQAVRSLKAFHNSERPTGLESGPEWRQAYARLVRVRATSPSSSLISPSLYRWSAPIPHLFRARCRASHLIHASSQR